MWKNMVEPERPPMTIWYMRIACWIRKATNTLSEYVINTAFQMQKRLHQRPPMLPCTYIACLLAIRFMHSQIFEVYGSNRNAYRSEKKNLICSRVVAATCEAQYTSSLYQRMATLLRLYSVGGRRFIYVWNNADKGKQKYSEKNAVPVSFFSQQTPHKLVWDETGISVLKNRRLSLWAVAWNWICAYKILRRAHISNTEFWASLTLPIIFTTYTLLEI
jgi:hypothetical protein